MQSDSRARAKNWRGKEKGETREGKASVSSLFSPRIPRVRVIRSSPSERRALLSGTGHQMKSLFAG